VRVGSLALALLGLLPIIAPLRAEWEPPIELARNDSSCYLALANCWSLAAAHDTLHAVWYGRASGSFDIFYRRSPDGGLSWEPETRMSTDSVYSGYPAIAAAGSFVHLVWIQGIDARGDSYDQVRYRRSSDGGAHWDTAVQLSYSSGGYYGAWFPCVVAQGSNVYLAWEDDRQGDDMIYFRRSTNNGLNWSAENPTGNNLGMVNASLCASGPVLLVAYADFWNECVYFQRSTDYGNTWLAKVGIPTPDVADAPCVACRDSVFHIVFCDGRNGHWDVWYRRSTDQGLTWSTDTCIMPDLYQTWTANIAVSEDNVHVVRGDMGMYQVHYIASSDGGLTWSAERCLSESVPGSDAMHYSVAVSDSTVHVIWDKGRYVYYRRNPGGSPTGLQDHSALSPRRRAGPNPFVRALRMDGRERQEFEVFDFTGRRLGVFVGASVAQGLLAGVYCVRPKGVSAGRLRVVKIR